MARLGSTREILMDVSYVCIGTLSIQKTEDEGNAGENDGRNDEENDEIEV